MSQFRYIILFFMFFLISQSAVSAQKAEINNLIDVISSARDFDGSPAKLFGAKYSALNKNIISFYRQVGDYRQLWFYNLKKKSLTQISTIETQLKEEDILDFESRETSYLEDEISWCPVRIKSKQWFVFVSAGKNSNADIYLGELDAKQYIKLTSHREPDSQPVWSPDGNRIAFVSARSGNGDIYIIDNVKNLIEYYNSKRYNASNEGKLIFDISNILENEIYTDSDNRKVRLIQLTDNKNVELYPNFSPSGKLLAITSKDYDNGVLNFGISIINLDGYKSPKRFTTSTNTESKPVWTPDGKYIIYFSSGDIDDDTKSIVASKFDKYGDYAKITKVLAHNVVSSASSFPSLTHSPNDGYAVVFGTNENKDKYSIWSVPIKNVSKKKLLFTQKSFIENVSCLENSLLVTRQMGDEYSIGFNYSINLQNYQKKMRHWTGEISKSKTLFYYICGGVMGVGGIIAWILSGGEVEQVESITLGTPKPPKN